MIICERSLASRCHIRRRSFYSSQMHPMGSAVSLDDFTDGVSKEYNAEGREKEYDCHESEHGRGPKLLSDESGQ